MFRDLTHVQVFRSLVAFLLCFVLSPVGLGQQANAGRSTYVQAIPDPTALSDVQRVAGIEAQLKTSRAKLDAEGVPLQEVARRLSAEVEIPIRIQTWALEDVGLAADTPVTLQLPEVALDTLLRLMLRELDLTYILEPEGIVFTTPEEAEDVEQARFYNIEGIVPGPLRDYDSIIELIGTIVEPESWEAHTGPSSIVPYENGLILKQTLEVHQKIAALLVALEKAKNLPADRYPTQAIIASPSGVFYPTILERLRRTKINVKLGQPSIVEIARLFQEQTGTPFFVDRRALEDIGETVDNTVDLSLEEVTVHHALEILAEKYELTWYTLGEVVVITTLEEAENELDVRIYPVRDLTWKGLNPDDPQVRALIDATKPLQHTSGGFGFPQWVTTVNDATIPELPGRTEDLLEAITIHVESNSWEESGGPGSIAYFYPADCLVISQTQHAHQKVAELLQTVRNQQKPLDRDELAQKIRESEQAILMMFYTVPRTREGKPKYSMNELNAIAKRIQSQFGKGTWNDDSHFIDVTQDRLMIRHRREIQRQIHRFWSHLGTDDSKRLPWQNNVGNQNQSSSPASGSSNTPAWQPGGVF